MHLSLTAWPHPGITPLELWDVTVFGKTLFERRDEATFFTSLAHAVVSLGAGEARRADGTLLPRVPYQTVALVGGAVDAERVTAAFAEARITADVVSADAFFTVDAAARAISSTAEGIVVVDVGQTSIKALGPRGRGRYERGSGQPEDRAWLARFIARAIENVSAPGSAPPSLVLLALPCELIVDPLRAATLVLGASTYPTAGDAAWLVDAIGARATSVALVNDAVLAAWALSRVCPRAGGGRLVLTMGLGIGAAFEAPA